MELKFRVAGRIAKPVGEVFEAVVNPVQLSAFFTTGGAAGRLETGATVTWDFADFPGAFPVHVIEVVPNERIVLEWAANEAVPADGPAAIDGRASYDTTVTIHFRALEDGRTLVEIAEEGWRDSAEGLRGSYGNCEGWTQMLCSMKAWLEHGVKLREGMYA